METLHVMIDIETLGQGQDAIIVAIGAVAFNPVTGHREVLVDCLVDMEAQQPSRRADFDTLKWWMGQPPEVRQQVTGDASRWDFDAALSTLAWAIGTLRDRDPAPRLMVWAKSPTFDLAILRHAFKSARVFTCPWSSREEMDVRTLKALCPPELCTYPDGPAHTPVHDCMVQIDHVEACLRHLGRRLCAQLGLSAPPTSKAGNSSSATEGARHVGAPAYEGPFGFSDGDDWGPEPEPAADAQAVAAVLRRWGAAPVTWIGEVEEYGFPLPESLREKFKVLGELPPDEEWVMVFNYEGGRGGLAFSADWDLLQDATQDAEDDDRIYLSLGKAPVSWAASLPEHEGF